jgi:hypothetical protein
MTQVKNLAKSIGIKAGKLKKAELIRKIQIEEGNFPCYATAEGYCDQEDCIFREDCLA